MAKNKNNLRFLATAVVVYGVIGFIVSLVAFGALYKAPLVQELPDVSEEFSWAAGALSDASVAAQNMASSMRSAREALYSGANLTEDLTVATSSLSAISSFSIANTKPFARAESAFDRMTADLSVFASDIRDTADALESNAGDAVTLGERLKETGVLIDGVARKYDQVEPVRTAKVYFLWILGYFIVFHAMFAIVGYVTLKNI